MKGIPCEYHNGTVLPTVYVTATATHCVLVPCGSVGRARHLQRQRLWVIVPLGPPIRKMYARMAVSSIE